MSVCLTCEHCGMKFYRKQRQRFCGLSCRSKAGARRGADHPTYKGRVAHNAGYVRVWAPDHALASRDGYVLEHRKVLFDAGISVPDGAHVHHRNGDKTDNRPDNLEVLPASEHMREHRQLGDTVVNQFGTFVVLTVEQRREKRRGRNARRSAR